MIEISAKDLMEEHIRLKKEQLQDKDTQVSETAKQLIRQRPYYMLANRRDDDECR